MAELSPSQLDELEDGLEELAATTDVPTLGLSDAVSAEMEAYRSVLDLVQTHLSEEDPSPGVLDDVLAKAYAEAATVAPAREPVTLASTVRRRRWWMPALALAGVSAAVLVVVNPEQAMEGAVPREAVVAGAMPSPEPAVFDELDEALARAPETQAMLKGAKEEAVKEEPGLTENEQRLAPVDTKVNYKGSEGLSGLDLMAGLDGDLADKAPLKAASDSKARRTSADARARAKDDSVAPATKARSKQKSSKSTSAPSADSYQDMPEQKSPFAETADPKSDWGEALMEAHALRRRGKCDEAMSRYKVLARHDEVGDALLGEVYGGMGLCAEVAGSISTSTGYFGKARRLKPGLDAWLKTERGRTSSK